jgi:hypothetical protein
MKVMHGINMDTELNFHFIVPTCAMNIKKNFNTIVLVSTLSFKNTSDCHLKFLKTLVKTPVDHRVLTSVLKNFKWKSEVFLKQSVETRTIVLKFF